MNRYRVRNGSNEPIMIESENELWDGAIISLFGTLYDVIVIEQFAVSYPHNVTGIIEVIPHRATPVPIRII